MNAIKKILFLTLLLGSSWIYAQPPGTGWTKVFEDNFNGNALDNSKWFVRQDPEFKDWTITVSGGRLKIDNVYNLQGVKFGGWIQSKTTFKYGYYEAEVYIDSPANGEIWPTWWVWGGNFPGGTTTEFDLMEYSGFATEYFNNQPTTSHHYRDKVNLPPENDSKTTIPNAPHNRSNTAPHKWAMLWTPTEVSFYYDGVKYLTSNHPEDAAADPEERLRLIFSSSPHLKNSNTPSNPTPGPSPGQDLPSFIINYVRVWQGGDPYDETPPLGSVIALRKSGGDRKYVTAEKFIDDHQLIARSNVILEWEKFNVESHPDGGVALKAQSNDKYIQVNHNNPNIPVKAKGLIKGAWEGFQWKYKGDGKVALKSLQSNKWLQCSWDQNNAVMYPRGNNDLTWETFDFTILGNANTGMAKSELATAEENHTAENDLEDGIFKITSYANSLTEPNLNLDVIIPKEGNMTLDIYDLQGKALYKQQFTNLSRGGHTIILDGNMINLKKKNIYLVNVTFGNLSKTLKLIF